MRYLWALMLGAALAGCATGYTPNGLVGGYSEVQLNETTYQVSVEGNRYTSNDRAQKIMLLRAAQLALKAGYSRFALLGGGVSQQYAGSTPITISSFGNTAYAYGGHPITKPSGAITVQFLAPSDPRFASALDAKIISAQLMPELNPK